MKGFGTSDKGKVRKENQDSYQIRIAEDGCCAVAVVCDGMGGALAGSTASAMAVDSFMTHTAACLENGGSDEPLEEILRDAVKYANIKVYDRSYMDFGCMGMGTTLVGVIVRGDACLVANVGDSRLYHIGKGTINQITTDHSLVEHLIRSGQITREAGKNHPQKNIITRALGVEQTVQMDIFSVDFKPDDILLLCTDGLSNLVSDDELLAELGSPDDCGAACTRLLQLALERGAGDNVTLAVLVR